MKNICNDNSNDNDRAPKKEMNESTCVSRNDMHVKDITFEVASPLIITHRLLFCDRL